MGIPDRIDATRSNRRAQVLYDGHCAFCRRSVALLRRLDWLGRLAYADARDPAQRPAGVALDPDRLLEEMHVLSADGRRVYHGFAALRWLAWRLPLLWPVAPLLYLPGVPALGQRLYLWVARNRFRLVPCHGGVCTLPSSTMKAGGPPRSDSGGEAGPGPSRG
jgi:predicted DCC family thiol-disulfide oxidoreductase YuxK